jgi:hypothetical protein
VRRQKKDKYLLHTITVILFILIIFSFLCLRVSFIFPVIGHELLTLHTPRTTHGCVLFAVTAEHDDMCIHKLLELAELVEQM